MYHWDSGLLTGSRLKELLARLDRTQYVPTHQLVTDKRPTSHYQSRKKQFYVQHGHVPESYASEETFEQDDWVMETSSKGIGNVEGSENEHSPADFEMIQSYMANGSLSEIGHEEHQVEVEDDDSSEDSVLYDEVDLAKQLLTDDDSEEEENEFITPDKRNRKSILNLPETE